MFQGTTFRVEFRIPKYSIDKEKLLILLNFRSISFIGNRSLFFIAVFSFYSLMIVIRVGIHRMVIRIANRKDPDQTALKKQSDLCLLCLSRHFWQANSVLEILKHLP